MIDSEIIAALAAIPIGEMSGAEIEFVDRILAQGFTPIVPVSEDPWGYKNSKKQRGNEFFRARQIIQLHL